MKLIHILLKDREKLDTVCEIIAACDTVVKEWRSEDHDSLSLFVLVADEDQDMLDSLQDLSRSDDDIYMIIQPVEATFPKTQVEKDREEAEHKIAFWDIVSREELADDAADHGKLDGVFLALVVLSAVVAVFALIDGNIALLIGAMVLTPLLGPNLALAFSTATGDFQLMKRAVLCGLAGFGATFVTASVLGYFLGRPAAQNMQEMLTEYGFESIPIAVCAGTAATLYMLKGTQSPLIGVMVAIAFLPPIAMTGLAMVTGQGEKSIEAFMLFAINLVCFNLAANTVLLVAGLRPRFDKDNSFRGPMLVSLLAWCTAVSILASILLFGR